MKKSSFVTILLFLVVVFALPVSASAAANAGVKPGSFFYFFDTTFERVSLFFTFSPEKKAQKALEYADERLAEAEALAEEKDTSAVKTAVAGYENNIAYATEESKQIKNKEKAEGLLASITDNTSKHQEILSDVLSRVPDEAKEAITKAIEASRKGQDEATKQIAELKGEIEKLKKEVAELKKESSDPQANEVEKLKKEVEELRLKEAVKAKTPQELNKQKSESASVPVTAEPIFPPTSETRPTQNNTPTISSSALESELLKFLKEQILRQTKSDLDYYQKTVLDLQRLYQMKQDIASRGEQNCLASYNSNVDYLKQDAERQKTAYYESRRGFATMPSIEKNIEDQLARDLRDLEIRRDDCIARYKLDTSISDKISWVSNQLSSIQQRVNSGGSVSPSETDSVGNEIISITRAIGNSVGVSGSISLPQIKSSPSSVTCTNNITGFSCRDNFGSSMLRCSQGAPGYLNCTDSDYKSVTCQSNPTAGSVRCFW
ncbi:MAG: DUF5667 domain-containing protein [Candidatus Jorgensenbacteria bacterium]